MKTIRSLSLILFLSVFVIPSSSVGMVLSEIMFNPDGDENSDEFIELYNNTPFALNLNGWQVTDGEGTDLLIAADEGLTASPGQYVLILDPDYIEDGSTTYDGMIPEEALVITIDNSTLGSRGLSNSQAETVSLLNPSGDIVSSWAYTLDNDQGISEEKRLPEDGDIAENWGNSQTVHGTPGARNSITPPDHDLSVCALFTDPLIPDPEETFTIVVRVRNLGLSDASDSLRLSERDFSEADSEYVVIASWHTGTLASGDSIEFPIDWIINNQVPVIYKAELAGDDDILDNNMRTITVNTAAADGEVLFNEIMYRPDPGMAEWIEIVNTKETSLSLTGWSFADGTGIADSSRRVFLPEILLEPLEFALIASDSTILFWNIPQDIPLIIWNSSIPSLNNNGDSLLLYDHTGNVVDRMDYRTSWGNDEQGVSLERISILSPTNQSTNWASSVDSSGATPGRINSQTIPEGNGRKQKLTLEPNPFSPDGDGKNDVLSVRYRLDHADSRLEIKIFDVRGREVRRLINNVHSGFTGEVLWDGTSDSGRQLPTGVYIVYLEALGEGGTRILTDKRVVALARRS